MSAAVDHHPSAVSLASGGSASLPPGRRLAVIDVAVTRRVPGPIGEVVTALDRLAGTAPSPHVPLADAGWLTLDAESACVDLDGSRWRGRGQLHGRRRWTRSTTVDVELSAWSASTSHLRLRARGTPTRWGRRRLARYFALAHLVADELRRSLAHPAGPAALHHAFEVDAAEHDAPVRVGLRNQDEEGAAA